MNIHSQGRLRHLHKPVHNGKNRALVYRRSISGWWQRDTKKVWLSLTHERFSGYYRNTSYLGWWLILRWLPRRGDTWTDPREWGYLLYIDLLLYFLDQRVWGESLSHNFDLHISHQEFSPRVHPHPLPLDLWHKLWRHGDVLSWSPFENSLSSYCKCCKWALWGSFYAMTHPWGGIMAWPVDVSGQPWRAIFTPDPSWGQLRLSGQWSSLILPSPLPCFFPPDSTMLTPRAPLIHIPALSSIWVCIPENQLAICIRKHFSTQGGVLFENYWLHMSL